MVDRLHRMLQRELTPAEAMAVLHIVLHQYAQYNFAEIPKGAPPPEEEGEYDD